MFEQNVGDGANLFVVIMAIIIGFASALGFTDFLRTKKEDNNEPE
ncbi:MAG: hypothetical protein AABY93_16025 [Bacteroidota bacterium]